MILTLPYVQPQIISRLDSTYLLIVLQNHPNYKDWLCNNCIHLLSICDNDGLDLNFTGCSYYFDSKKTSIMLKENIMFGRGKLFDEISEKYLIRVIIEKLREGYYVVLSLDDFFLEGKFAFNKFTFYHLNFILGYDDEKQIFQTCGYDEKDKYRVMELKFGSLLKGFSNDPNKNIYFLKSLETEKHIFILEDFIVDLKAFLFGDSIKYYFDNHITLNYNFLIIRGYKNMKLGMNAQKTVVKYLEKLIAERAEIGFQELDMRTFRVLSEHKNIMAFRLKCFFSEYKILAKDFGEDYLNRVAYPMSALFKMSIKYNLRKKIELLQDICSFLKKIIEEENMLLHEVLQNLED